MNAKKIFSKRCVLYASMILISMLNCVYGWTDIEDPRTDPSLYNIGVGIHDITGPAAGVNMMGYANPAQINKGIHMRLYSRAYLLEDGIRRFVFASSDCGMMGQLVKMKVIERLQADYGDIYTTQNVMLSGTHTHSGPAGYQQYLIYDITSLGFIQETLDAMVEGIYMSIVKAHENVTPGYAFVSIGALTDASINRSPASYANNPQDEIDSYEYNTDNNMTLVRFVSEDGRDLGMLNWFSVHGTSMNNTNPLISGDNKGYASQLFEKAMNPTGTLPGEGEFVAAFAQTNCGDVSPNTQGPICQDTGEPCDILTSTCGGRVKHCYASGPGKDMMESTKIIGEKQFKKAMELYNDTGSLKLSGPVQFISQFIDMSNYEVTLFDGTTETKVNTCTPALGYSFAAGTTDGPGAFDFTQGMTTDNPFWNAVVNAIHPTSNESIACHAPKPVLLDTGNYNKPYPWHPRLMETQIGRLGQLLIMPVPGEFTTMAGRRIRNKITESAASNDLSDAIPVIGGLSNVYSHYITTPEEYEIQRYEGASTLFGPNTMSAYIQQYVFLLNSMANNETIDPGQSPPDLSEEQLTLLPGVLYDSTENQKDFGSVAAQPYPLAYAGETVITVFVAGHPRNTVGVGGTFLTVEMLQGSNWTVIATDSSWETRFLFERTSILLGTGEITIYWDIPEDASEGTYRINHYGHFKSFFTGIVEPYQGTTADFQVVKPSAPDNSTTTKPTVRTTENSITNPPSTLAPGWFKPVETDPFSWLRSILNM